MKKILNLCFVAFCMLFIAGCSEDENTTSPELLIVKSDVDIDPLGSDGTIEFDSQGKEVTAKASEDWCQIKEVTSSLVKFSVGPNTGYMTRCVQIILTDGASTKQVAITQSGAIWKYNHDIPQIAVDNAVNEVPIEMSGTFPIEVEIPAEANDWLTYQLTDKGFKFKSEANSTGNARATFVIVKSGTRKVKYAVIQCDGNDLLGKWSAVAQVSASAFGFNSVLPFEDNTQIVAASGGKFQFQLPIKNLLVSTTTTINLSATFVKGRFVVTAPQQQTYTLNIGRLVYGSIIVGSPSGLALQGNIYLTPYLMDDGNLVLVYGSESYLSMGLFNSRTPSTTNFTGYTIDFPVFVMQR